MPIGVLNPGDATHATAARPTAILSAVNQRRWFSDPLNTEVRDQDLNAILAQIRHCIDHYSIPDVEGDDTLLRQAIQAGAASLTGNIAQLQAVVGGADRVPYWVSAASMSYFIATTFSRDLMNKVNLAQWQSALGITAGASPNVVAFSNLTSIVDTIGYFTGSGTMALTGFTATARTLLDDTTTTAMRTTLGLGTAATADIALYMPKTGGTWTGGVAPFVNTQSVSYVFAIADVGALVKHNSATPHNYTINPDATTAYPHGPITIASVLGNVTVVRGAGVSLFGAGGADSNYVVPSSQAADIVKIDANTWRMPLGLDNNRIMGNVSGAAAAATGLTAAQVKTMLGYVAGDFGLAAIATSGSATDLITGTLPVARVADASLTIAKTSGLQAALDAKLAAASYTAADVLAKLLTVDGAASTLDADLLDAQQGTYYLDLVNATGTLNVARIADASLTIAKTSGLQAALDAKVALTGAAFTGAVSTTADLSTSGGYIAINRIGDVLPGNLFIDVDAGQTGYINLRGAAGAARWILGKDAADNFTINTDAAVALTINRATRIVDFLISPTVPTPAGGDNTTKVATTAYVTAAIASGGMTPAGILAALLTVDGAASALDADLLDAQHGTYYLARANHTGTQAVATITGLATVATSGSATDLTVGTLPVARIAAASLTLPMHATQAANTLVGNNTAGAASPIALTVAQTKTMLAYVPADLGLAAIATSGSATDLTVGTLPPARIATAALSIAQTSGLQAALDSKLVAADITGKANLAGAAFTGAVSTTGDLSTSGGSISINRIGDVLPGAFYIDVDAAQTGYIYLRGAAGANRWIFGKDGADNFTLNTDAAAALTINRATRSVDFLVIPTAPTPTAGDNTTKLATTAYVVAAVGAGGMTPAGILANLITVDGAGSLLDADFLDAQSGAYYLDLANATGTLAAARIADASLTIAKTSGLQTALDSKVTLTGAAFTGAVSTTADLSTSGGNLNINRVGDATSANIYMDTDAGFASLLQMRTGVLPRWVIGKNATAEAGTNAGSDFYLHAYNDAGTTLGNVFVVSRATRILDFTVIPTAPTATAGDNTTKLATTQFVTAAVGAGGMTPAGILAALITVDGAGSTLDADLLDAQQGTYYLARANHTGTQAVGTITGLATVATSGSATDLAVGTLPNARIVALPLTALATQAASTLVANNTAGAAAPIAITVVQAKTMLAYTATDLGLATIATSGSATDLTTGTLPAARIAAGSITLPMHATQAAYTFVANNTASAASPIAITVTQAKTLLTLVAADIGGLAPIATSGSATDLTTGTLPAARIAAGSITLPMHATQAAATFVANNTGGVASPIAITVAQAKTLLAIAAADVTGLAAVATSGSATDLATGVLPIARILDATLPYTKLLVINTAQLIGNISGSNASPVGLTVAQVKTMLGYAAVASSGSATDLTTGTLDVNRIAGASVTLDKLAVIATDRLLGNVSGANASPIALTNVQVKTMLNIQASNVGGLAAVATSGDAGDLTVGILPAARMAGAQTAISSIAQSTIDGSDTGTLQLAGGGGSSAGRGGYLSLYGNEHGSAPGRVQMVSGTGGYVLIQSNGVNIINDQAFTGTGANITGLDASNISSGTLSTARIADASIAVTKLAVINNDRILGNVSGGNLSPYALTAAQVATMINYNSADVLAKLLPVDGSGSGLVADLLDGYEGAEYARLATGPEFTGTLTAAGLTSLFTDSGTASGPNVVLRRDSSTPAAADNLGSVYFQGNNNALTNVTYAEIHAIIGVSTTGSHSAELALRAANAGTLPTVMTIGLGVIVGAPTGSFKGAGTLNATDVYNDNVLLTCVPLQRDFLAHGSVDLDRWDAVAPHGQHEAAHHFAKLLKEGVDPRDPMKFISAMREMQALPGMPTMDDWEHNSLSMGEIFGRLWLAVEMLAVAWMSRVEQDDERRTIH